MLGCGGYLEELRRTCIGDSVVENAITLERLAEVARSDGESPGDSNGDHGDLRAELGKSFIEIGEMIKLPAITVVSDRLSQVEHGVPLRAEDITAFDAEISVDQLVALRADSGDLLAIARALYAARELPDDPQEQLVEYVRVI
jgi:tRNA U55 pseudouridine synthase TruB